MAHLPATRVQQCRPFVLVGINFVGSLQIRELKLHKSWTYKVYIVVFLCLSVKIMQLEVV